jgi:protein gp37
MGDLFFHKVTSLQQHAVFDAMMEAPQHTYFILTKRPCAMIDAIVRYFGSTAALPKHWWWGVSVEDMSTVHRAVELLKIGGGNIFVSAEPLLGDLLFPPDVLKALKWCIIGGETGHGARPVNFEWAVSLFGQCRESGIPYLAKNFPTILNPPLFVQPEVAQRMADAFKVREFPMELA